MSNISKKDNAKNPDQRDPIIILIVGAKRQGKSTVINDSIIEDYVKNNPKAKVLIHDVSETHAFEHYPLIGVDDIKKGLMIDGKRTKWEKGVYRTTTKDSEQLIKNINSHFRNGLVVLDEARSWIPRGDTSVPKEIMELFTTHTNKNIDLVVVFHEWMDISTRLRGMANDYVIFRTGVEPTGVGWFSSRFFPEARLLDEAYQNVVTLGQKKDRRIQHYAYVMIDAGDKAIDYPLLGIYPEDAEKIGLNMKPNPQPPTSNTQRPKPNKPKTNKPKTNKPKTNPPKTKVKRPIK